MPVRTNHHTWYQMETPISKWHESDRDQAQSPALAHRYLQSLHLRQWGGNIFKEANWIDRLRQRREGLSHQQETDRLHLNGVKKTHQKHPTIIPETNLNSSSRYFCRMVGACSIRTIITPCTVMPSIDSSGKSIFIPNVLIENAHSSQRE